MPITCGHFTAASAGMMQNATKMMENIRRQDTILCMFEAMVTPTNTEIAKCKDTFDFAAYSQFGYVTTTLIIIVVIF